MHIRYTTETILTSLILVSRVWSRPFEVQCEGQRREGDKWFDGCRWCVCQQSGSVCSSSDCSIIASQLPACHDTGSSWRDGCYFCQCHMASIECSPDQACLLLLHSNRPGADTMSNGACVQPTDERCVCGIDGVPSCTAEVIDKNAFPAITIELNPTLSSSQSLRSPDPVHSNHDFKSINTTPTDNNPDITGENYGKTEEYVVDTNKYILEQIYNSGRNEGLSNSRVSFSQIGGHSVQLQNHIDQAGEKTVPEDEAASLLVVSANRCRWGQRWYGGRLRCYCGTDNSITCGDPNIVATRIDGFRLETGECEEGHAWKDKEDACTVCTCKISGVTLCHRSPSCRLPFLIKALPKDADAARNFEIGRHDQILNGGNEFTEQKEHPFVWIETADKLAEEPSFSTGKDVLTLDGTNTEIGDSEVHNKHITSGDHPHFRKGSPQTYYDEDDGSGDINFPEQTTTWAEDVQTHYTRINAITNRQAILTAEELGAQTVTHRQAVLTTEALGAQTVTNRQAILTTEELGAQTVTHRQAVLTTEALGAQTVTNRQAVLTTEALGAQTVTHRQAVLTTEALGAQTVTNRQAILTTEEFGAQTVTNRQAILTAEELGAQTVTNRQAILTTEELGAQTVTNRQAILTTEALGAQTVTNPVTATYKASTVAAKNSNETCTPRTRWLERGCRRCSCNSKGIKICMDSTCPRSRLTPRPKLTSSAENTPTSGFGRPVLIPPREAFWNRTGPIILTPPEVQNCGRFSPGDIYMEDCNTCKCATDGPMCTAMDCS